MIHVYNTDFEYQGEVDAFESLMWVRRWSKAGDFQIVLNAHTFGIEKLVKGHIITIGPDKTGIIAHIEEDTSESGKASDQILVRGLDLKGLIGKRITIPPVGLSHDALTANVETIMKRYVNANAVSTNPERIIPNLSIAPDQLRGPSFYYQTRHQSLPDELEKLSLASDLGWDVLFTGKGYVFDTPSGNDLSILQSVNSPVIFGVEFDNVGEQKIVTSNLDYRNVAIVAGQGEGIDREVVVIGDASGLDRNEVFIDARDIEDGANLPDRGRQKLSEYTKVDSFETEILTDGPFVYKKDWDLGDIVTIQNAKKTRTVHERIVEVTETHEKGSGFQLRAVFGNALPTLIEKIKRELDEPEFNDGRDGESGPVGDAGPRGPQGLPGPKGDTGERGPQGLKGDIGLTGAAGPQGERGLKGDTGLQGPKGDTGPIGPKGDTGLQGVKGATGATGPKGDVGYTPVKGVDYFDGLQGPKGDVGPRGLQGIQGVKGDTGPIGPKGDQGVMGPPGSSQSYVLFEKNFVSSIGQTEFTWTDGWSFPVGIRAASLFINGKRQPRESFTEKADGKGVIVQPGLDAGQYVLIVAQMAVVDLQGPQGIQGPQGLKGDKGDQGIQGLKGATGATGLTGPMGPKGDAFKYADFTALQLEGLRGPQGAQGVKGDTGSQGLKGDKGDTGPIGLQGTKGDVGATGARGPQGEQGIQGPKGNPFVYTDFTATQLASLKGDKGDPGAKGATGATGPIGLTGAKGDQGIQGVKGDKGDPFVYSDFTPTQLAGLKGEKGDTGATGAKGDTGARGLQGIQGIQGVKGDTGPIGLTGPKGDKGDTGAQGPPGAAVADSVEWLNVLGRPTVFSPSAHTHPASQITGLHSAATTGKARGIEGRDSRSIDSPPSEYMSAGSLYINRASTQGEFKSVTTLGLSAMISGTYCYVLTHVPWSDKSGGYPVQVAYGAGGAMCIRCGETDEKWGAWSKSETVTGVQEKLDGYKPFHIGAAPPANKNLIWYDTN